MAQREQTTFLFHPPSMQTSRRPTQANPRFYARTAPFYAIMRASMINRCLAGLASLLCVLSSRADVIINEIHYDPDIKTELVEFIELYNTGATSVDLSGWALTDAVAYTFP